MLFETDCEIKLVKDGELIVDTRRASLLRKIEETGSLDMAAAEIGVGANVAMEWLDTMGRTTGTAVTSHKGGRSVLTEEGAAILAEFETRTRVAGSQVRNLWKKPWVTADGIVLFGDQVVLIKRGHEPFKGMYALPDGIVEYGETVEECAVREVEEETGLRTRILDLVGVYSEADRDPRGHFVSLAFNLAPIGGQLLGGDDAAEAVLFPLDQLPEMAADHRKILSDALLKRDQHCRWNK